MTNKTKTKQDSFSFKLNDGCVVQYNKAIGYDLIKARKMAGKNQEETPYCLIAETATFDNKKLTKDDILEMNISDVVLIEEKWNEFVSVKNS